MTDAQLIALARAAALNAYAPYSGFHVGCAIASSDGQIVTGVNIENACYRLGQCAEQSALSAAQTAFGLTKVARIAVAGGPIAYGRLASETIVTPCGGCRQAILEAARLSARDIAVICAGGHGAATEVYGIAALLPNGFGPQNPNKESLTST